MDKNYRAVVMCSRHKDNKDIEGFKPRHWSFLIEEKENKEEMGDELIKKFLEFVSEGGKDEMSRLYVSINRRDVAKAKNKLIAYLATTDNWRNLDAALVSKAMEKDCDLEGKWLLDVDTKDLAEMLKLVKSLSKIFVPSECVIGQTLNGFYVITPRGFDTRELLKEYPFVGNKKDGAYLLTWCYNNEEAIERFL